MSAGAPESGAVPSGAAPPRSGSLFTAAYVAACDGHDVIVECRYPESTRRGRLVVIAEGDPATRSYGHVLVQWSDRSGVQRIESRDFHAPRYSIRVVERQERAT